LWEAGWNRFLSIYLLYIDQVKQGHIGSQLLTLLDEATFTIALPKGWKASEEQATELAQEFLGGENWPRLALFAISQNTVDILRFQAILNRFVDAHTA
jgi:hypothetical protein